MIVHPEESFYLRTPLCIIKVKFYLTAPLCIMKVKCTPPLSITEEQDADDITPWGGFI